MIPEAAKSRSEMTPERWEKVRKLLDGALGREPHERSEYLNQACANDSQLRSQVESLIASSEESGVAIPSNLIATRRLSPGTMLGRFEIVSLLGVGGMGEVYRARDTQLKREVAIKVLPADLSTNRDRLSRFEQEARATAALNHPNILAIYELGRHQDQPYIVSELLEGHTLREALQRDLPLPRAIDYGLQIAQGVAAAHDKGIIHRDLKPENIFVTKVGQIKVLDFGLAKLRSVGFDHETLTSPDTDAGVVLGTLAYMSPEQVRGQALDQRSDMFSLGTILYEILTRTRAFPGDTPADVVGAILHDEPKPLCEIVPSIPWELQRVITRCLQKNPERRLRSMADLAVALQDLKEESDSGTIVTHPSFRPKKRGRILVVWTSLAVVVALSVATGIWLSGRRPQQTTFTVVPITTYPGVETTPSLSPDGNQVAFSWNGPTLRKFHIYVKAIGPGPPLRLTNTAADDTAPAWSPDAGSIAFLRGLSAGHYRIILIPALGGPERTLTDILVPEMGWLPGPFLSWMPDSHSLVFLDKLAEGGPSALFALDIQSGEKRQLTFPPAGILGDSCAAISPNGQTLAFCRCAQMGAWLTDIYTSELGSGSSANSQVKQLTSEHYRLNGLAWNAQGNKLVFGGTREEGETSLWSLPVPSRFGAIATKLEVGAAAWPTVSQHSSRLAFSSDVGGALNIWRQRIPDPGKVADRAVSLIASTRTDFAPQYSPDGKRIAFESTRGGSLQIWTCDSDGVDCLQLTSRDAEFTGTPGWSPDGKQIAFYSRVQGKSQIFIVRADGMGVHQVTFGDFNHFFPRWSRDGRWIYCSSNRTGSIQVWKVPSNGGDPVQVTRNGGFVSLESPDGKWLYYTKTEAADSSLWKKSVDSEEESQVLPSIRNHNFDVVKDGIYFIDGSSNLNFFDTAHGTTRRLGELPPGYVGLSVSPDRKWILYTQANPKTSELMLVENFQ